MKNKTMKQYKTSEWVSPKHPDKMADRISDAILDAYLRKDKDSRVAIETMGAHGKVYIAGEVTSLYKIPKEVIKDIVKRISGAEEVEINIIEQSREIARGVDNGGAGDQGIMNGYACSDNEDMIPQEMYLARSLGNYIYSKHQYDGKTQITIDIETGAIDTIVASFQNVSGNVLRELTYNWLKENNLPTDLGNNKVFFNPAGDWNIGGFEADAGLTGRKLAVDNYGTSIAIGGGAFSGKDASKVDRSGAYMARKIAVDLLKKRNAKIVKVKLAYAIGVAEPVQATAIIVYNNLETEDVDISSMYDLTPNAIIELLGLKEPIFEKLATDGHFGKDAF